MKMYKNSFANGAPPPKDPSLSVRREPFAPAKGVSKPAPQPPQGQPAPMQGNPGLPQVDGNRIPLGAPPQSGGQTMRNMQPVPPSSNSSGIERAMAAQANKLHPVRK